MALTKCHECGNDVSSEAKACPKCGARVKPSQIEKQKTPMSSTRKIVYGIVGVALVCSMYISGSHQREEKKAEEQKLAAMTSEQRTQYNSDQAKRAAEEKANRDKLAEQEKEAKSRRDAQIQIAASGAKILKQAAKDPDAFELTKLVVKDNGTACYDYRAKNSFGAILPGAAVLTTKGKLLVHERDGNTFVSAWNKDCSPAGGSEISDYVKRLI